MGEIGKNKDVNEAKQHEVTNNVEIKEKSKEDIDEARKKLEDSLNSDSDIVEQKNPHIEEIDGKKYYYDDNGKLYRVQDNLAPNTEYEINGYKYKTDDNGRVISAEGTLHIKNHDGKLQIKDSMDKIGKGDEIEGDQRGPLIGVPFDGANV